MRSYRSMGVLKTRWIRVDFHGLFGEVICLESFHVRYKTHYERNRDKIHIRDILPNAADLSRT